MSLPVAILAGGLGTRMYPQTRAVPKAMLTVAGEPFVAHQLRLLAGEGCRRIVFLVGYLGEVIENFVGDGARYGLDVVYSYDGGNPLGTAGAVAKAVPLLGDAFLLTFGDAYLRINIGALERAWRRTGTDGMMSIFRSEGERERPNVLLRDGFVRAYDKQAAMPGMEYIDYGLSAFRAEVFLQVPVGMPSDLTEINHALIRQEQLAAYVVDHRPFEIGSPAGLDETENFLGQQRT